MNRRGFLRMLGALAATAALPVPEFVLAEPQVVVAEFPIHLSDIRQTFGYDIYRDVAIVRLDVFNKRLQEQFFYNMAIPDYGDVNKVREKYLMSREEAQAYLRKEITSRNWNVADMAPLPSVQHNFGRPVPEWAH